jgi:predicted metal-binding membrane protein
LPVQCHAPEPGRTHPLTTSWVWRHRDRLAVLVGLGGITVAAWVYVVVTAHRMVTAPGGTDGQSMPPMADAMTGVQPWTATEFGLRLAMWAVMMVAMMVPATVPMTLMYAAVARKAAAQHSPLAPTFVFVTGYITMWTIFSVVATIAQHALDRAALLSPMMVASSARFGAALLIAAGIYQLTPFKNECLKNCRAPAHFMSRYWRTGNLGAFRLGLRLGAYCVGCCWILMALLFVGGVMNLLWIAAIAIFVLLEKTIPFGDVSGRAAGAAMILVGALSLAL